MSSPCPQSLLLIFALECLLVVSPRLVVSILTVASSTIFNHYFSNITQSLIRNADVLWRANIRLFNFRHYEASFSLDNYIPFSNPRSRYEVRIPSVHAGVFTSALFTFHGIHFCFVLYWIKKVIPRCKQYIQAKGFSRKSNRGSWHAGI